MNRRRILFGGGAVVLAAAGAAALGLRRMGSMADYDASVAMTRAPLPQRPEMADLIRFATLAANGHNTQPWRFRIGEGRIEILPDVSRRTPIVDPDDHHLFASLGCAAENLSIAAGASGQSAEIRFEPAGDGAVVVALAAAPALRSPLIAAIPRRQSTRADYDGRLVPAADLKALAAAAAVPGVDLVLITDRPRIERVRDLVIAGNSAQMADPAFVRELRAWLRFNPREALAAGDGLFSAASANPTAPSWLGPRLFDWFFRAEGENDRYARQLRSSPGIAVFAAERDDRDHWVRAGRACQRFALQATVLGLTSAFLNQPVEVAGLRPDLAALAGIPGRRPDIVLRFGYGPVLPFSARRPVEAVLA